MSKQSQNIDSYSENSQIVLQCEVSTTEAMQTLGTHLAQYLQPGDVLNLSGPLGAGKTTLTQGIGDGLSVNEPIVSPTFTIARELSGTLQGASVQLIHVDAYRLFAHADAKSITMSMLLDELETLGMDEILDNPDHKAIAIIEWGEELASLLTDALIALHIKRPVKKLDYKQTTSQGVRIITLSVPKDRTKNWEPLRDELSSIPQVTLLAACDEH